FIAAAIFSTAAKDLKLKIIDKDLEMPLEGVKIIYDKDKTALSDIDGNVNIKLTDDRTQITILAFLPGYSQKKITIKDFSKETSVFMSIEGVTEGKELVINEQKVQEKQ